jgi:hypothetical protein
MICARPRHRFILGPEPSDVLDPSGLSPEGESLVGGFTWSWNELCAE